MIAEMDTTLLTYGTVRSLLYPKNQSSVISAEQKRPWSRTWTPALRNLCPNSVLEQLWDGLLMRTYDEISGSQPCPKSFRMLARASRMRLDEEEMRIGTLETHLDHKNWEDTPYISFTDCPQSLEELANYRCTRSGRSKQRIVVVDRRIRIELGLPILHCSAEIANYGVKTPYNRDYWENHYLCLWEVTPAEVVGIWDWDDLRRSRSWYQDIIVPAVAQQRERVQGTIRAQRDVLQDGQRRLDSVDDADQSMLRSDSDVAYDSEDVDEVEYEYESDDSYERVCEENMSGQLMNMLDDLYLD